MHRTRCDCCRLTPAHHEYFRIVFKWGLRKCFQGNADPTTWARGQAVHPSAVPRAPPQGP